MSNYYHSLAEVSLVVGPYQFTEYSEDGLAWVAAGDQIVASQGARGAIMVSEMFDNVSELTVNIVHGSPNNAIIDAIIGQFHQLLVTDLNSGIEILATAARLIRRPPIDMPQDPGGRELVFLLLGDGVKYGAGSTQV